MAGSTPGQRRHRDSAGSAAWNRGSAPAATAESPARGSRKPNRSCSQGRKRQQQGIEQRQQGEAGDGLDRGFRLPAAASARRRLLRRRATPSGRLIARPRQERRDAEHARAGRDNRAKAPRLRRQLAFMRFGAFTRARARALARRGVSISCGDEMRSAGCGHQFAGRCPPAPDGRRASPRFGPPSAAPRSCHGSPSRW